MEAIRVHKILEKDGELVVANLPYKKGQSVEVIVLPESKGTGRLTANRLLTSDLIGLWEDHPDVVDSTVYARTLRERAQQRQR
jgi:hypothetical protein